MFFRRKPKAKPEEEDSLVPHGLIWQATAQEEGHSGPTALSSPALNSRKPAMDARFDRPPSGRKLGAISPPIAWPSPRIQEIPKRPHSRAETERIAAMAMGQVISVPYTDQPRLSPVVVPKIEPPRPQVLEARQRVALPSPAPKTHRPLRERFPGFGARLHAVQNSWASARQELGGNVQALIANLRHGIQRTGGVLSTQLHRALSWPSSLKSRMGAILTTSARATQKLLSRREEVWRRVEIGWQRSAARSGAWKRKIRAGLHSGWSRPIAPVKASISGWKSKSFRLKFDSRLWTSMAMAGASAGLALGMISLVGHYSPQAAPVRTPSFRSASPVKHVKATSPVSHPNVRTGPALEKPSAARTPTPPSGSETASKSPKLAPRKVQARKHRSRNSEDADYVARDTYVYYGSSGKNGR